ncbi:hypothetical protein SPRG_02578 [Saprolegnia parasitica CBS 223.65]|uniref:Uncharacterized protein n=1 Tax=Saprolegnia parasitica (strain CBS 223.65) TaxID=695850 RepID=A0A067D1H7_SAPPC|nr:hypothetical protein SPRG_02578 [Saprolegnia parasitica CBS 223.65]KDO32887.1 hypothetical protein SPRG_02578 [Saprolegnia parasitica CBS 223.65]|eukprot:XP_012196537.1 hypothetical protein SPRG_02578 [Saprolegnia parasitica CBS 223.65]
MAQLEGYRCPIVVRTAHIQPYDMPRYVGEVISQLHELSQWTTKCATMLNQHHPFHATPPMPKPSVPTTILSEVELLKRSLNVVEKQQSNKLVTEIAYLQCALRSEADEKMTAFEHFVETRLGQSIREHTHVLQMQQDAIATKMEAMAATMGLVRSEVDALQTRVGHVEEMLETNASVTSEALQRLHTEATHYAKQREKADLGIGNQLAQTRLHVQDAIGSLKVQRYQGVYVKMYKTTN